MSNIISVINCGATGPGTSAMPTEPSASGAWSDWVGMVASIGCAVHCAAMPFVIAYLPALGLSFLADVAFHKWMAVVCFLLALLAFIPGFRRHRRSTPVIIASVGLLIISVAAFGFAGQCCPSCDTRSTTMPVTGAMVCTDAGCQLCTGEDRAASAPSAKTPLASQATLLPAVSAWVSRVVPWLTPLGGIILVSAHLLNRRYGHICGCFGNKSSHGAVV